MRQQTERTASSARGTAAVVAVVSTTTATQGRFTRFSPARAAGCWHSFTLSVCCAPWTKAESAPCLAPLPRQHTEAQVSLQLRAVVQLLSRV